MSLIKSLLPNHLPIKTIHWLALACCGVLAVCLYGFDGVLHARLNYDLNAIKDGAWWRLFSAHFLHTNLYHLLLNLAGLLLLWALHGEYYQYTNSLSLLFLCTLGTAVGLFGFSDLSHYVGLSGMLHGLFAWGVVQDIKRGYTTGWLLLAGLLIKLLQEQIYGGSVATASLIQANVAVDAHLYGALSGFLAAIVIPAHKQQKTKDTQVSEDT